MEQSHVALSGPSPLTFRGAPEDRSQSWDEREALLDLGQLVGSCFKTREPSAPKRQPLGKQGAAGSQRGTERLKRGKGRGFSSDVLRPLRFCFCPAILGSRRSDVRLLVQQLADD